MKKALCGLCLALALLAPALPVAAQQATEAQTEVLMEVAQCLAAGLPDNWEQAEMLVELEKPGAEKGNVRYLVRRRLSGGQFEPFRPCDERKAAHALVTEFRALQAPDRRGWRGARFVVHRDGNFNITFDYP
ncbi:MAG TPA: hypothetical protein VK043_12605 [Burkholderiales bacterium]|nr:hypothetical protein [Burkholderiales bacterium]